MWRRRAGYALAVLGALLGQILDAGYLLHYIFMLTLAFPLLALALSLPAMLGCRGRLAVEPPQVVRGRRAAWSLVVENRSRLPLGPVKGRVSARNRRTGAVERRRFFLPAPAPGERETWRADTARCALVEYTIDRLWVCDCLGIFALPVRRAGRACLLVCPAPEIPAGPALPRDLEPPGPARRGGARSGEDYELRPYRPGDSLRRVHWKQSAKRDRLVVREPLEDRRSTVVLTFDHFGPAEALDRALDRLEGSARVLLERGQPFEVRWAQARTGAVRRFAVEEEGDYRRCLAAILSEEAPAAGRSILEFPLPADREGELYHIHLTGEEVRHGGET